MMSLTQARLKEVLEYNLATGEFTWREPGRGRKLTAGCKSSTYTLIFVDGKTYRAHRLAWLYMKGTWPERMIDHIDLDKHNNAFHNLREATGSQNKANRPIPRNNTSGFKGVSWAKGGARHGKPWQAQISANKTRIPLGLFSTREEAHAAYCDAAKKIFGEFARTA
jgi:hypothetical protein